MIMRRTTEQLFTAFNSVSCRLLLLAVISSLLNNQSAKASLTCFAMPDRVPRLTCVASSMDTSANFSWRLPPGAVLFPHSPPARGIEWLSWRSMGGFFRSTPSCVVTDMSGRFDCFGVGTDGSLFTNYYSESATPLRMRPASPSPTRPIPWLPIASGFRFSGDPSCIAKSIGRHKAICFMKADAGTLAYVYYDLVSLRNERPIGSLRSPSLVTAPKCLASSNTSNSWCLIGTPKGINYTTLPSAFERDFLRDPEWGGPIFWTNIGLPAMITPDQKLKCAQTNVGGLVRSLFGVASEEVSCFIRGHSYLNIFATNMKGRLNYMRSSSEPLLNAGIEECIYTSDGALACFTNRRDTGLNVVMIPVNYKGMVSSTPLGGSGTPVVVSCARTELEGRQTIDCVGSETAIRGRMRNIRFDRGVWSEVSSSIPGADSSEGPGAGIFQLCDPVLINSGRCI